MINLLGENSNHAFARDFKAGPAGNSHEYRDMHVRVRRPDSAAAPEPGRALGRIVRDSDEMSPLDGAFSYGVL
jgi:hypothetical protein